MAITKAPAKAVLASSFGGRQGFISPRSKFLERRDKDENRYVVFTMIILAVADEFMDTHNAREFEVWVQGEDIKTLQNAFPNGMKDVTKEQAYVTLQVTDEYFKNYKDERGDWVNAVIVHARSITLPNITS